MKAGRLLAFLAALAASAAAQAFPERPLRFYVGFPPGSSTDLISRLVGQKLADRLRQPVVLEQKVGGSGVLANDAVAKSPPDGHTLVLLTGAHPASAAVMKSLPFHPVKDFGMVGLVGEYPMVLSVAPDSPFKSLGELLAKAKAQTGRISYASPGSGSLQHLVGEWLNIVAGSTMVHTPFKSAAPAFTDLVAGRIDLLIETATFSLPQIRSGRLRPLAHSFAGRYPLLPDVPAVREIVPGVEFSSWLGVAVAPGTPQAAVERLNRELAGILAEEDLKQRFADFGGVPAPSTPEAMRERVEQEIERWKHVVEARDIERQ